MTGVRPPPRDQPTGDETEELRKLLAATLAERTWLRSATRIVRGPGAQRVHVFLDGSSAALALVDLGQLLARRDLPTADLLAVLERDGQTFDVLATLASGKHEDRPRPGP